MKRKIIGFLAACLATASLCSCNNSNSSEEKTYVSLDINPSIELIVNSKNVVTDVYATNDDAKVLLYNETIEGKNLDSAVEEILNLSIEYGYLSEDNKVVEYTISSTVSNKKEDNINSMIKTSIDTVSNKAKLEIKFNKKVNFTIERQLEALKSEYPDNEAIQNLSAEQYRLILSAMESDNTLTIEAALELNVDELIEVIKTSRDEFYNIATQKYNEAVLKKEIIYHKAFNSFSRNVYSSYYLAHTNEHPINYGALYSLYGQVADTLDELIILASNLDNSNVMILSEGEIAEIKAYIEQLGVKLDENLDCLRDGQENITIDSVNAYLNKLIKNLEIKDPKVINKIKEFANQIEKKIHQQENEYANTNKNDLKNALTIVNTSYNHIKLIASSLSNEYKTIIEGYISELDELITVIKTALEDSVSLEQLKSWSKTLREKEEELLNTIKKDLSEEELAEIDKLITNADASINNAKNELDKVKEATKKEIEKRLKDQKELLRK